MGFPPLTSDSQILMICPCSEALSAKFVVIQTHLSRGFDFTVDFLGLRRSGSSSEIINQAQNFLKQASWNGNLGQLKRDVTTMADNLGSDLDQLLP